jgi:hypothetical protein
MVEMSYIVNSAAPVSNSAPIQKKNIPGHYGVALYIPFLIYLYCPNCALESQVGCLGVS